MVWLLTGGKSSESRGKCNLLQYRSVVGLARSISFTTASRICVAILCVISGNSVVSRLEILYMCSSGMCEMWLLAVCSKC